jgi:hypothetical protein
MMPFGASGFGAGINASNQSLAIRTGGGGNGANKLEWYFVPQLLSCVLRHEVQHIAKVTGYQPCDCPFCQKLPLGAKAGHWDFNEAGLHYLWWCAKLTSEQQQNAAHAQAAVKKRINDAKDFAHAVRVQKVLLDPRSSPAHLAAWTEAAA